MIGLETEKCGCVVSKKYVKTVKKELKKGESIARHHHEGKEIVFIVVKGQIEIKLDGVEKHLLIPGKLLQFNGQHFIEGEALEDTSIFVTLVDEGEV